jgi:hypothetical protein
MYEIDGLLVGMVDSILDHGKGGRDSISLNVCTIDKPVQVCTAAAEWLNG